MGTGIAIVLCVSAYAVYSQESKTFESAVRPILQKSCEPCHNPIEGSGGLNVKEFENQETLTSRREVWLRIMKRMKAGEMPPRRAPQPAGLSEMVDYLERELGRGADSQDKQP